MSGLAANGPGTAGGSGWPDIGIIHPIPTPFGSMDTGIKGRTAGIGNQAIGTELRTD
jgi:hypothetical protein